MGRGISGAVLAPPREAGEPADSDQRLVAAVRCGDDRAFELLYERYQRRIHAYVFGMVKDHGRAEDVTQEVFVSALRRMRETEQPLAFKPWLYQIAKNGCIDAFRRSQRAEEVSYDADDALAPADHSKLVGTGPSPDAAVAAKQDLDNLCGAFGGLSETHHEILVLRELEGLSYQQIGKRMGMSRQGVESTLFRARRRLTEEYDDIVSGARCERIQGIIVTAVESRLGARDTRRLARHLSHCQGCRREALAAGLDRGLFTRPSVRERLAARVGGLLPLPAFLRFRRGGGADAAAPAPSPGWTPQLPLLSDHLTTGWGKAAAGAAMLVASVGAGVGVHRVTTPPAGADRPVAVHSQPATPAAAAAATATPSVSAPRKAATTAQRASSANGSQATAKRQAKRMPKRAARLTGGSPSPAAADRATSVGGGPVSSPSPSATAPPVATSRESSAPRDSNPSPTPTPSPPAAKRPEEPKPPVVDVPAATPPPPAKVVDETVKKTTDVVDGVTQHTTQTVDQTVNRVTGGGPLADTVNKTTDVVDQAVGGATQTVNGVTQGLTGTLGRITGR